MQEIGKTLMLFGVVLIGVGLLLVFVNKIPFLGKLPGDINIPGKLPGDIYIEKKNFTFYLPVVSSILVSLVLSVIFWLRSGR